MPVPMVMPIALRAPRAAPDPPFAQHGAVGVVVELGRQAEPVVDDLAQRQVHPAEVGGEQHDAALGVERARRADADAEDLGAAAARGGSARWRARPARPAGPPRARAGLGVGRLGASAWRVPPSSATLPTTRLVPPMSMPRTYRTAFLRSGDLTVAPPPSRPGGPACTGDGPADRPAGRARSTAGRAARRAPARDSAAAGAEPERRHRGAEDRHDRRAHRGRQVQRRRVVGDQHRAPARSGPPRPAGSAPRRRSGPARRRGDDFLGQRASSRPPITTTGRSSARGELRVVRPPLGAPDRPGASATNPGGIPRSASQRAAASSSAVSPSETGGAAPVRAPPGRAAARPRGPRTRASRAGISNRGRDCPRSRSLAARGPAAPARPSASERCGR